MKISRKFLETMNLAYAAVFSAFHSQPGARVPTGKALRNPNDPVQAERIRAANWRRVYRGHLRRRNQFKCVTRNPCIPLDDRYAYPDVAPAGVTR